MKTLGKIGGCLVVTLAALGASAALTGGSLMDILVERLGKDRATIAAECASGVSYSDVIVPANCFDGIRTKAEAQQKIPGTPVNCSWLATMSQNPYVTLEVPDAAGRVGAVRGYRLTRMVTGYYSRDRAPTAWRIEGSDDGTDWTQIDVRSGVVWAGSQTDPQHTDAAHYDPAQTDCEKEFICAADKSYKYLRFTPTASPHTADTGNVGLIEIEYYVVGMTVFHGIDADDKSGFSCADGDVLTENATVSAPDSVGAVGDWRNFTCVGNVVQELDGGDVVGVQTNKGSTYSFVADGKSYRLTWLWSLSSTTEPINYRDLIHLVGGTYVTEGGTEGEDFPARQGADHCFDGITVSSDASLRYTAKVGSHVTLLVSDGDRFGDMLVVPVRYRLWQHSTGYYCNERAPTSWTLEGSNDGLNWEVLDEVVDYTWYAQTNSAIYGSGTSAVSPWMRNSADMQLNCVERELDAAGAYLSYRLTMTAAKYMEGKEQEWDVGLMEIEIDVRGESMEGADGHLTVANNLDVVGCVPKPGVYQVSKAVGGIDCSAPERFFQDGRLYLCRGYSEEVDSGEGWSAPVTNLGATAYRYVQSANEVRLTWIWEHVANLISVSNENGGETLTYSPAADYENPDEPGARYYTFGKTIEVAFDTATAPTPSCFTGEIAGDTNGVTIAADRLTFSSDEPRRLTAYFERHWKYLPAEENDGESAVTDGNWTLAASNARASDIVDANGTVYAKANEYLCFLDGAYRAGCGRLDLTLLNTDLAAQRATESRALPLLWLGNGAFAHLSQLTELIVPADIVGGFVAPFQFCTNLVSVSFAPSFEYWVTKFDRQAGWNADVNKRGAFDHCQSLVRASLPNARYIPSYAFDGCSSLKQVKFSPRLEEIGYRSFSYCRSLSSMGRIELPRTFSRLEGMAFQGARLDVLDLSRAAVTNIPAQTFSECLFNRIILPKKLERVDAKVFEYAMKPTKLEILEFTGKAPPEMAEDWMYRQNETKNSIAVLVPGNCAESYMTQEVKGKPVFVPKDEIPNITTLPNYDTVAAYGNHFLGSWYGTWLLSTPNKGLMIFVE